jgi:hypothetical protein
MILKIESTDQIATVNGVRCRLWMGHEETGVPCKVFVALVAVANDQDATCFDRELLKQGPPAELRFVDLRQIL